MFIFLGMAIIAGGAWTHAFQLDQPAAVGRTAVVIGSILLLMGLSSALRKSGGRRADRGGVGLWWLGVTVLTSCVSLMGLVYITVVPDFGAIQQDLVRGLLTALAISETLRLLLFGFSSLRR
ncbi:hypothetical protein [Phenylobacterium immobile]|uniref:hypothetical protein n=1 Tax=Phenylobacterium immobile TaxID=21 RepID=UPI000A4D9F25|nr:hypothetical protein [Phenylobacterium immobile]